MSFLFSCFELLSAFIISVRLQIYSLVRATMSVGCVNVRFGCPLPFIISVTPSAAIVTVIFAPGFRACFLNLVLRSALPLSEATAIMQSPRGVISLSFVNSKVVLCVPRMFLCPKAVICSAMI